METVPKQGYENARKLATVIRRDSLERQATNAKAEDGKPTFGVVRL